MSATARVVVAGLLSSAAAGTLFAWSVVSGPVAAETGVGSTGTATVFSTGLVFFTLSVLVVGALADRWSARALLLGTAVVAGGGLAVSALAPGIIVVGLGFGVLFAFASGAGYVVPVRLASRLPVRARPHVMGVVVAGYAAGPILLGVVGPGVVDRVGWRSALAGLAVVVAGMLVAAALLTPSTRPERHEPALDRVRSDRVVPALLWLLFAFGGAPGLAAFAHALDLGRAGGLSPSQAGLALVALSTGNFVGRLLSGPLAQPHGVLAALALCLAAQAGALVTLLLAGGSVVLLATLLLLGTTYGAVCALIPAATAQLTPVKTFGRTYGRVFSGWGVAGLLAPVLAARLVEVDGWPAVHGWSLVTVGVAAVVWVVLRRRAVTPAASRLTPPVPPNQPDAVADWTSGQPGSRTGTAPTPATRRRRGRGPSR